MALGWAPSSFGGNPGSTPQILEPIPCDWPVNLKKTQLLGYFVGHKFLSAGYNIEDFNTVSLLGDGKL